MYRDYGTWIREQFPFRVQKISIDAGFTCPNRDGRKSRGGCIFCDNTTFNPSYCNCSKSITQQLEEGKVFFGHKYPEMRYLAYFQAYSNTYAPLDVLKYRYEEALGVDGIVGLVIGTRPDCVSDEVLDYLADLSRQTFLVVEYGVESCYNKTLALINRHHSFDDTRLAIEATHQRGIITGAHIILGLPGESKNEIINSANIISSLPIDILKIHQMQVIRGTRLADMYMHDEFHTFSLNEYLDLLTAYLQHLRSDIILERFVSQAPKSLLLAPDWGLKNHEFTDLLRKRLKKEKLTTKRIHADLSLQ